MAFYGFLLLTPVQGCCVLAEQNMDKTMPSSSEDCFGHLGNKDLQDDPWELSSCLCQGSANATLLSYLFSSCILSPFQALLDLVPAYSPLLVLLLCPSHPSRSSTLTLISHSVSN